MAVLIEDSIVREVAASVEDFAEEITIKEINIEEIIIKEVIIKEIGEARSGIIKGIRKVISGMEESIEKFSKIKLLF